MPRYKEHRGVLIRKYQDFWGRFVFVIEEENIKSKIYVGKGLYQNIKVGSKLTVGELNRKLINIRPGICKNGDEALRYKNRE